MSGYWCGMPSARDLLISHVSTTRPPVIRRVGTDRVGPGHQTRTNKIKPTPDGVPDGRCLRWHLKSVDEAPLMEGTRNGTGIPSGSFAFSFGPPRKQGPSVARPPPFQEARRFAPPPHSGFAFSGRCFCLRYVVVKNPPRRPMRLGTDTV